MGLSTCEHCGGYIPLGPDASNRCEVCGKHVFSAPDPQPGDRIITDYVGYAALVNEMDALKDERDGQMEDNDRLNRENAIMKARVAELEALINDPEPVLALRLRCRKLDADLLDMGNTLNAIADPDDYEAGGEKTAETCRRIAAECVERNRL